MAGQNKPTLTNRNNSARNYLIIVISLFVLVCLSLGFVAASTAIESLQRWLLIGTAVVFALVGLVLSVWIVIRQSRESGDVNELGWRNSPTENQRRRLNENLREIVAALESPDVQTDDVFSAYIVAEDLALRQIQQESRENLLRHQNIGGVDFDAILVKSDVITCLETTFLVAADVPQSKIDEILSRIKAAKKFFEKAEKKIKLRLLLVLITQLDQTGEAKLRSSLVEKFSATAVDVDIRLFDFEDLQRNFAL